MARLVRRTRRHVRRRVRKLPKWNAIIRRQHHACGYWWSRLRGARGSVHFAPAVPHHRYVLWKVTRHLGLKAVGQRRTDTLASILWLDTTKISESVVEPDMINARCLDISKTRVERAMQEVFGYSLGVDPTAHRGPIVAKSDENGTHDGQIVEAPLEPKPGKVYQRLVNTRAGDTVEELRAVVVADKTPLVYVIRKPSGDPFANANVKNATARLCDPGEVFSREELEKALAVCAHVGLDLGGVDLLRDRDSERLYVADVNRTSFGPPLALSNSDARKAVRRIATAFTELLLRVSHHGREAPQ